MDDIFVVTCISCALMVWLLWEWAINLSFEVSFLKWSNSRFSKSVYCISRYLGLCALLGNVFFVIRSHNLGLPPPPIMCIRWFSSLLSVSLVLMLNLELLLLARVYAMYRHCLSLVIVFGILLAAKIPVTIFLVVIACRKVLFMGATCIVQSIPSPMVAIGCLEIVAAILIMAPTAIRYVYGIRQNGGQPIPLLQLILRDGMITFTLVSGLFLIIIIDMKEAGEAGRIIFPVAISVVSVATCRIIRNLRNFPVEGISPSDEFQLTSMILSDTSSQIF